MAADAELLREFVERGSEDSFQTIVERHSAMVHAVAQRIVHRAEEAQEVTQAVFVILARKAGTLPARTILAGWLYRKARFQMGLFLIPTAIYGGLMLGQRFPVSEAQAAGLTFSEMFREFGQPVLLVLLVLHALIGYVELGVDGWITNLMTAIANMNGVLVLLYTSCIMFILRFCAGPIVHRLSPLGLLLCCSILACIGLIALGNTGAGWSVVLAATTYGVGKTFFWPTMLGVVSERFPKGGALRMGTIAGVGMLSAGLLGSPGIGYVQDYYASKKLSAESSATYARYAAQNQHGFLFFPKTTGLDGAKTGELISKPESQLSDIERSDRLLVNGARIYGGRMSLKWTAVLPAVLATGYLGLIAYFRRRGGYHQIHLRKKFVEAPARAGERLAKN